MIPNPRYNLSKRLILARNLYQYLASKDNLNSFQQGVLATLSWFLEEDTTEIDALSLHALAKEIEVE